MYHFVCTAKYRKAVLTEPVDALVKAICLEIEALRDALHRDRCRPRPRAFSDTVRAHPVAPEDRADREKHHCTGDIQADARGQDEALGRVLLDQGILRQHGHLYGSENAVREYIRSQGREKDYGESSIGANQRCSTPNAPSACCGAVHFHITTTEWLFVILAAEFVLSAEAFNTAIETHMD